MDKLNNTRIRERSLLPTSNEVREQYPIHGAERDLVVKSRRALERILLGKDHRLLAVVGPCSMHNMNEVFRYAKQLARLSATFRSQLVVVMRFCGDKPRTGKAWPGFWSDPYMDGSYDFVRGWTESRRIALRILELGLPLACEFLDTAHYQYIDDLVSYTWVGARDVGSQPMRKRASGLSTPVGLKNHNSGGVDLALNAIEVVRAKNFFADPDEYGKPTRFKTAGNPFAHLILRGTKDGPNYDSDNVAEAVRRLTAHGFLERVVVDVSHDNSRKDHKRQADVIRDVVGQVAVGGPIAGFMYESFLQDGRQDIPADLSELRPGVSVTDACDGWERTEEVLRWAHRRLSQRRIERK